MFKKISEITTLVKVALKYKELAEFIVLLYKTIMAKIDSKSGKLSDDEKAAMKKEFGEAIDKSF